MEKALFVLAVVAVTFFAGSLTVKGKPQQQIVAKVTCAVPKGYADFKGMSGQVFIFENPSTGTIKTLTCASDGWVPQIQITRE